MAISERLLRPSEDQNQNTTLVTQANQVTEEILQLVFDIVDGWYPDIKIDWEDLVDRVDGAELSDGSTLDLGDSMVSPAIKKIKREVRKYRSQG